MVESGRAHERLVPLDVHEDVVFQIPRGLGHAIQARRMLQGRDHRLTARRAHRVGDLQAVGRHDHDAEGARTADALEDADDERSAAEIL